MTVFSKIYVVLKINKFVPSFLKLRTMLAEGTEVRSLANRLYSSNMYSGGSLRAASSLGWGLSSVRFSVDRNWLRKSCASRSGLSPTSLPTDALWWFSGVLMGLLKLKPVNTRSRTFRDRTNPWLEKTEAYMVEWRKGLDPKNWVSDEEMWSILWRGYLQTVQRFEGGLSLVEGQQVAVGGKEKTALPLLILWFGSEGRAVLSNVLCWHVWRCHQGPAWPSSFSLRQELMTSFNFCWYSASFWCISISW